MPRQWFEGLVNIYIECFSEPPWNERWENNIVAKEFKKNISFENNISLIWLEENLPMGATMNYPIVFKEDVRVFVPKKEWQGTMYLAETFVDPRRRRQGIAKNLHGHRLEIARESGFTQVVQRTSGNSKMFPLIEKTGFKKLAIQQTWSEKEEGGVRPDERVISIRSL